MSKLHYAIVFVSDMKRSIQFYRDTIELPLKFESPEWSEFATQGVTLALHSAEHPESTAPADRPVAGLCQVGFQVDNLDAFHEHLIAKGVPCLGPPEAEFGVRLARYTDPDGLRFTVSEVKNSEPPA